MNLTLLILASIAFIATAQECPQGYEPHLATDPSNQIVQWTPCPVEDEPSLECATLDVLLDYTNASLGTLPLTLVRVPANSSSSNGKSIFFNPGGPGESGIDNLIGAGPSFIEGSGGIYHIVTFDPRGVGLTMPYECPEVNSIEDSSLPKYDPRGLNATYIMAMEQGELCGISKYRQTGELMGSAFVARDINAVFEALGEDGLIRYWGYSYGTLLGATLAAMFPDKIDRMVLDGNINPTDYYHGLGEESVDSLDPAVLHFFESCAEAGSENCAWASDGSSGQHLQDQFYEFLAGVKNDTYTVTDVAGTSYSYDYIRVDLYKELKQPLDWYSVAQRLSYYYELATNSSDQVKRAIDPLAAKDRTVPMTVHAVNCGDWDDIPGDLTSFEDWFVLYQERSKFGGDIENLGILYQCSAWQVNAREKYGGTFTDIETRTPLLFVNGHYDPVTPLVSARNSSSGFVNSKVLEFTGAGHCTSDSRSSCIRDKVAAYFVTGELPDVNEACDPDDPDSTRFIDPTSVTEDGARARRSSEEKRFDEAISSIVQVLQTRDANAEFAAALHGLQPDAYNSVVARRESETATTSATLIPAKCTPVSATGTSSSTTSGETQESENRSGQLSDAEVEQGLSDLKTLCSESDGQKWFLQLICGALR